jgi:hypothetical protein
MLKMNNNYCIYKGKKFSQKKSKDPPFGLKIQGNNLKRPEIRKHHTNHKKVNYSV